MRNPLEPEPRVSVVIRTYNSWTTTREIVERLVHHRQLEIILVDSGSGDLPTDIDRRVHQIVHHREQPFSYGGSLNAGVAAARGEWTWVLSSHCIPIWDDVVSQIEKLIADIPPEVVCVLGATLPAGGRPPTILSGEPVYSLVKTFSFPGGNPNCLYRTASLRARPFDERLLTCEDIEWFIAAKSSGASVAACRSFPVRYRTQRSVSVMFRKGLDEYRVGKCLGKPRPKLGWRVFARIARNFAKVLLGRLAFGDFLRKESYILGWFCAETFLRPFTDADIRRPISDAWGTPPAATDLPRANSAFPV